MRGIRAWRFRGGCSEVEGRTGGTRQVEVNWGSSIRIAFADFTGWDFHALTVDCVPMGGSQSAACYLARTLAAIGHEVFLISSTSIDGTFGGVACLSWKRVGLVELRALKLDAMICVLAAGAGVRLRRALGPGVRLILWSGHADDEPAVQALRDPEEQNAYDGFAMVSQWQREQFNRAFGLDDSRTTVLRYAVAPAFANLFPDNTPILPQKALPPILAYTSTPFRGLDLLLDAFPAIRAVIPDTRLQVFSSMKVYQVPPPQDEARYGDIYDRCRHTKGVEYIGSVPQPELARSLRRATMLAYPNTFPETACIAVMEAMASGCRILTSHLGALPETTAGFGRLIAVGQGRTAYLSQFIDEAIQLLRECSTDRRAVESALRAQVDQINAADTWMGRANEWCQWLSRLCAGSH